MQGDCTLPYDICACGVVGGFGFCDGCSMTRCQYECSCDEWWCTWCEQDLREEQYA